MTAGRCGSIKQQTNARDDLTTTVMTSTPTSAEHNDLQMKYQSQGYCYTVSPHQGRLAKAAPIIMTGRLGRDTTVPKPVLCGWALAGTTFEI